MTSDPKSPHSYGLLIVVAAPSGTGKTSLVRGLLDNLKDISLSISYTTRPQRTNEVDGQDYCFVSVQKFQSMIDNNAFLEYATVFGNYYGTSRKCVERNLEQGLDVLLELDWQGARQIQHRFAKSVSIFFLPPSREALEQRLLRRGQDDPEVIVRRNNAAVEEMSHYQEFDYLVVNDDFNTALSQLICIVRAERLRQPRQSQYLSLLLQQLLQKVP